MADRSGDRPAQAERDLEQAKTSQEHDHHERASFAAQQAAEKAVKALHLSLGQEAWGHVVMSGAAPRPSLLLSTWPQERPSPGARSVPANRILFGSCVTLIETLRRIWFISWWTIAPHTNISRSSAGWRPVLAIMFITRPSMPPGSIRWRSGLILSPNRPFEEAASRASEMLIVNIKRFVNNDNPKASSFVWTVTADSIP